MDSKYDLQRFLNAQEYSYNQALAEIKSGKKCSHWIWYIFPQIAGLGRSSMCVTYGIKGLGEAKAYLAHPVLKQRLEEISQTLLECARRAHVLTSESLESTRQWEGYSRTPRLSP